MSDYDYTRESEEGAAVSIDDFVVPTFKPRQTADEIEKENGFRDVSPGDHVFVVHEIFMDPPQHYKAFVDFEIRDGKLIGGLLTGYLSRSFSVVFALASDPNSRVRDWFLMPPENPDEHKAFNEGIAPPDPGKPVRPGAVGFSAKKYAHFLDRLGVVDANNEFLPGLANLGKWKGRAIGATAEQGRGTFKDKKTGIDKPRGIQIKNFSYWRADAAGIAARLGSAQVTRGAGPSGGGQAGRSAGSPGNGSQASAANGRRPEGQAAQQPVGAGVGGGNDPGDFDL